MTNNHQNYPEHDIHSEELLLERRNNEPQSVVVLKRVASYSLIFTHPDQFLVDGCGRGLKTSTLSGDESVDESDGGAK